MPTPQEIANQLNQQYGNRRSVNAPPSTTPTIPSATTQPTRQQQLAELQNRLTGLRSQLTAYQSRMGTPNIPQAITPQSLTPAQPYNLPTPTISTVAGNITATAQSEFEQMKQWFTEQQTKKQNLETQQAKDLTLQSEKIKTDADKLHQEAEKETVHKPLKFIGVQQIEIQA